MHEIYFYKDRKGKEPVLEYMRGLRNKRDKDSRIKLNKINDYIQILSKYGTQIGEPYIKHLEGDIWELRPLRGRILFVGWANGSYVLLHYFMKKTQKTPLRELEQAKRELSYLLKRGDENG
ncbi:MAG: type II toxin-antitoxin system RelE/ParE family toxin [Oscillospiraceae bacterium]